MNIERPKGFMAGAVENPKAADVDREVWNWWVAPLSRSLQTLNVEQNRITQVRRKCWWTKSCTSLYGRNPISAPDAGFVFDFRLNQP